jgi:hypothetical protein
VKLYQRAAQAHPKDPAVFNNMAVHYARRGMRREAIAALDRAIQLRPGEPRYRNNLAMLLVEVGRPQEAFFQLRAVHDEAVAHYNLGFLLSKKGQFQAAAEEFTVALRFNPALTPARQWLDRLAAGSRPDGGPPGYGPPALREEPRLAAEPMPRGLDTPQQGPLEVRPAVPEPTQVRLLPPPSQSGRVVPPGDSPRGPQPPPPGRMSEYDAAGLRRLPPISNSPPPSREATGPARSEPGEAELPPPYWPLSR